MYMDVYLPLQAAFSSAFERLMDKNGGSYRIASAWQAQFEAHRAHSYADQNQSIALQDMWKTFVPAL